MPAINNNPTLYFEIVLETGQVKNHSESDFEGIPGFSKVISSNSITVNTNIRDITKQEIVGYTEPDEDGNSEPIYGDVVTHVTYYTYSPAFLTSNSADMKAAEIHNLTDQISKISSDLSSKYFLEVTIGGVTKTQFSSKYASQLAAVTDLQAQIESISNSESSSFISKA